MAERHVLPIYFCLLLELVMFLWPWRSLFLLDAKMIFQPLGCYEEI